MSTAALGNLVSLGEWPLTRVKGVGQLGEYQYGSVCGWHSVDRDSLVLEIHLVLPFGGLRVSCSSRHE